MRYHPLIPADLARLLTSSYSATPLSIATLVVSLSILLLGIGVLVRGRRLAASRLFFLITLCASLWQACFGAMYAAEAAQTAELWGRLGNLFGSLIPAGVFHFASEVVGRRVHYRPSIILFWLGCAGIGFVGLLTDLLFDGVRRYSWGWYAIGRPFGALVVLGFSGILIASVLLFWRAYRSSEGKARERALTLLLAFILGSLSMFDYLPSAGIDLQPIGYVAALAFFVVATTAVWRFEIADITPEFAAGQILETMKGAVLVADMSGTIRLVNRAAVNLLGYDPEQLRGAHLRAILPPVHNQTTGQLITSMGVLEHSMKWHTANGSTVDVLASSSFLRDEDGSPVAVVYVASDYTERKRAEEKLRRSEERYRELFENANDLIYTHDLQGTVLSMNLTCERVTGYSARELIGKPITNIVIPDHRQRGLDAMQKKARGEVTSTAYEIDIISKDGRRIPVEVNTRLIYEDGKAVAIQGIGRDISDRKHAQEQMEYQAYHDALTSLPNRLLFRDRISVALAHAKRSERCVAVMFLDLDQFKLVNDTLGHTVGDRLLQVIGARLVNCVRGEDTVARMGGDEFTILLADQHDRRGAVPVAQKVLDAVRHPIRIDEHELFVTTSIGISIYPENGDDAETLLKNADRAMYHAKEHGRDNYQYATGASEANDSRLTVERALHHAIERDELVVHYHPMIEIASGRVVGAEALVRWNHPQRGLLYPGEFIPVAEETKLIVPLGASVLRTACAQMKAWHDAGLGRLRIAVNLSPRQFQDRELAVTVERILGETQFPAEYLDLEITESTAMQNAELSLAILNRLKEMGIRISIDDFGTGYSSLSYLKRFPIDTVKIDQEFVRDLTAGDTAIISAVISMARALNLRVIAEGVETEAQLEFLRREQCSELQGFLYSRPLPAAEFERALRNLAPVSDKPAVSRMRLTVE